MSRINELIKELCPNGVIFKKIGDIANYRRGSFPQPYTNEAFYGGYEAMPFVQVADVRDDFRLANSTKNTISKIAQPLGVFVPKGTVIVTLQGTIGRVAITQYDAYVDRTLAIFEGLSSELNTKYFVYQLKSKFDYEKQFARGSTIKTITKEEMTEFRIPIPPLEVQEEIVRILDKFGELEAKLEAKLEAELEARQSQYEFWRGELLNNKFDWKKTKLKDISSFANGKGHEKVVSDDGKYILLTSKAVSTDLKKCRRTDQQLLPLYKNDIALVMSDLPNGRALAKCFFVEDNDKFTLNQRVCKITTTDDRVIPKYLYFYLNRNQQLLKFDNRVDQTNLRKNDILEIDVYYPSISKQKEIVRILEQFKKLISDITEGLPAEIELRKKQYEYYRNKLLSFEELIINE